MRGGERALDDFAWVRPWAELAVLAHLTGWPMPAPAPGMLAALRARPPRLVRCAFSQAADAAVAVRPGINRAGALAAHVAEAMRARADGRQWWCAPDEPRWLIADEALTADVIFGRARPGALDDWGTGDRDPGDRDTGAGLPGTFIDCEWPALYLKRPAG
jgi:hypothetical protein